MRLDTVGTGSGQARNESPRRQSRSLALFAAFLLAACGGTETDPENIRNPAGNVPHKSSLSPLFRGGIAFAAVSADESRAAEVGRDILQNGGNAVDAAIAMYFTMAVTLPSAAGLGATGACVVHNAKNNAAESFVFAPTPMPGAIGGLSIAVPIGVRAMTLMHIRHGQLRWEQTVASAERIARAGVPLSRALSRDLQAGGAMLDADREARRIFGKGSGGFLTEGDNWAPADMASTLGLLRQRGGAEFFNGAFARYLSDQVAQMGGSLPMETLRGAAPQAGPPLSEAYRGFRVYTAPAPMAGASALAGWNGQAGGAGSGVPRDSGGISGLAAVDEKGGAAACSLSMGQLFGARKVVPGTGILLATVSADSAAVSPVVIANPGNGEFLFAGAGGGSSGAAYATGAVARAAVQQRQTVAAALAANGGRGGFVNAMACPDGIKSGGLNCQTGIDQAGSGLSLLATKR